MCLALPGKLIEIIQEGEVTMGRIDFSGTIQTTCLEYVPEVKLGEYVLVHAGFAITIVKEDEAQRSLKLFDELAGQMASEDKSK